MTEIILIFIRVWQSVCSQSSCTATVFILEYV